MSLIQFGEDFLKFCILVAYAPLDNYRPLPARASLGQYFGVLREATTRFQVSEKRDLLPGSADLLGSLDRFIQLRNQYVHREDRSVETGEELRRIFTNLVRYAGRNFRLQWQPIGEGSALPLEGTNYTLPTSGLPGRVVLEIGGMLIDMSRVLLIKDGHLARRDITVESKRWISEEGPIFQESDPIDP
jgi:hypothetical protein